MELQPNKKLNPSDFTRLLYPYAKETEAKTGISAVFILSQAAHESGWNKASSGWMFFGVKDTDGLNGNEQLLRTTEYSRRMDLKFPEIISITPVNRNGLPYYKYVIRDYFRKYDTPEECFTDHVQFFFKNKRYTKALMVRHDPYLFASAVAAAGYATDPNYARLLMGMIDKIKGIVNTV